MPNISIIYKGMVVLFCFLFISKLCIAKTNSIVENCAQQQVQIVTIEGKNYTIESLADTVLFHSTTKGQTKQKLKAALLTVALGMLGAHRLYMGTKPWVPIFYVCTFGGVFFILPIIDLVAVLTCKDITKFYNNKKVLMWLP
jgi:TM2 domain-containing membrane protein YozV